MHLDAIILDAFGYLPFAHNGGALLFHLISKLHGRVPLIVTTNLTFGETGSRRDPEVCRYRSRPSRGQRRYPNGGNQTLKPSPSLVNVRRR